MKRAVSKVFSLSCLGLLVACGPSAEEKELKTERVELMKMQHAALKDGEAECGAAQARLDEFEAKNKERIDKFNTAWKALDEAKRDELLGTDPQNSEEVNAELISLVISCPGVQDKIE